MNKIELIEKINLFAEIFEGELDERDINFYAERCLNIPDDITELVFNRILKEFKHFPSPKEFLKLQFVETFKKHRREGITDVCGD